MATEDKFRAAVNVIQALPKKGPFQPSIDLQLKFYALYKQATEGPNTSSKPYMWEVVKKFKWDAWTRLGKMTKEVAMDIYLKELNNIVETMAASSNVDEFLVGMDDFYAKVPAEDVDLCIGPTIEKIRATANRPLPTYPIVSQQIEKQSVVEANNINDLKLNEEAEEVFLDSIDTTEHLIISENINNIVVYANGHLLKNDHSGENTVDILTKTVVTLRKELNDIEERMKKLELQAKSVHNDKKKLFGNLSPQTIAFVTLWPIVVNLGILYLYRRNKKQLS